MLIIEEEPEVKFARCRSTLQKNLLRREMLDLQMDEFQKTVKKKLANLPKDEKVFIGPCYSRIHFIQSHHNVGKLVELLDKHVKKVVVLKK